MARYAIFLTYLDYKDCMKLIRMSQKMMSRTGSTSSASTQHLLDHTDLDTDEEMGTDRISVHEGTENRKQHKKKENYVPISRAATPVSKLMNDEQEGEKMIHSSSFDNLQEAFKRSLKLNG